jgi:hypothetical protein
MGTLLAWQMECIAEAMRGAHALTTTNMLAGCRNVVAEWASAYRKFLHEPFEVVIYAPEPGLLLWQTSPSKDGVQIQPFALHLVQMSQTFLQPSKSCFPSGDLLLYINGFMSRVWFLTKGTTAATLNR